MMADQGREDFLKDVFKILLKGGIAFACTWCFSRSVSTVGTSITDLEGSLERGMAGLGGSLERGMTSFDKCWYGGCHQGRRCHPKSA